MAGGLIRVPDVLGAVAEGLFEVLGAELEVVLEQRLEAGPARKDGRHVLDGQYLDVVGLFARHHDGRPVVKVLDAVSGRS